MHNSINIVKNDETTYLTKHSVKIFYYALNMIKNCLVMIFRFLSKERKIKCQKRNYKT